MRADQPRHFQRLVFRHKMLGLIKRHELHRRTERFQMSFKTLADAQRIEGVAGAPDNQSWRAERLLRRARQHGRRPFDQRPQAGRQCLAKELARHVVVQADPEIRCGAIMKGRAITFEYGDVHIRRDGKRALYEGIEHGAGRELECEARDDRDVEKEHMPHAENMRFPVIRVQDDKAEQTFRAIT